VTERQDIEIMKGFMEFRRKMTENPGDEGRKKVR